MKIDSKFHDYYDSIQGLGFDESTIFVREPSEVFVDYKTRFDASTRRRVPDDPKFSFLKGIGFTRVGFGDCSIESYGLLFCGKFYRIISVIGGSGETSVRKVVKDFDDLVVAVAKIHRKKESKIRENLIRQQGRRSWESGRDFRDWFIEPFEVSHELFFEYSTPIILVDSPTRSENRDVQPEYKRVKFTINSPLHIPSHYGNMKFTSVIDPYTAYQEIEMFLNGVLGEAHPPMIQIADKDMKVAKGFGHKYAFKKEPTKKR